MMDGGLGRLGTLLRYCKHSTFTVVRHIYFITQITKMGLENARTNSIPNKTNREWISQCTSESSQSKLVL
jgi:hypothetical protein